MLILLSPSKKLELEDVLPAKERTLPVLLDKTHQLIDRLQLLSSRDIAKLMDLSEHLANLNYQRFQDFSKNPDGKQTYRAAALFKGDVYDGLEVTNFDKSDLLYAQAHLRILSGLYGILRPLDLIQPHRLEMGTSLKNPSGKNLYQFWGGQVTEILTDLIKQEKHRFIINLASNEYFKVVQPKILPVPIITVQFKEYKSGKYRSLMLYVKQARGLMASYIIKQRLSDIDSLKSFNKKGYHYHADLSSDRELVFVR